MFIITETMISQAYWMNNDSMKKISIYKIMKSMSINIDAKSVDIEIISV